MHDRNILVHGNYFGTCRAAVKDLHEKLAERIVKKLIESNRKCAKYLLVASSNACWDTTELSLPARWEVCPVE